MSLTLFESSMPVHSLEESFDRNVEYEYNADPSEQAENAVASLPESPPDDETVDPEEEEILINEEPIFIEKDLERHEDEDTTTWLKRINLMASSARATKPAASTKATYTPPQAPNPKKIKISQSTPTSTSMAMMQDIMQVAVLHFIEFIMKF